MKLKQILKNHLTVEELKIMPSSFDVVGDILIFIEFPKELKKKEKDIARTIINYFKNINVVTKKSEHYSGKYRTPKIEIMGGENRKETIHKENNCRFKLDVEKCYFSARLGNERKRIYEKIKSESVLVMFSGIGIYPIEISKNTKAKEIYGIEINPIAHKYALENLELNKTKNVHLHKGDVSEILPTLNRKFDRIIMPLPKEAHKFLPLAKKYLNPKGIIHLYTFLEESQIKTAKKVVEPKIKKFRISSKAKCGEYSPRVYRVCLDIKLS